MTVNDLIDTLKGYPGDYQVVIARDPEGNSFSATDDAVSEGNFHKLSGIFDENSSYNAVVIWPRN